MDESTARAGSSIAGAPREAQTGPVTILRPAELTSPFVFASPHSGRIYPSAFVDASPLDALTLRRSEDSFVDELFAAAPGFGAPLVRAEFPRAYVDVNREPYELDPGMFAEPLPAYANTRTTRVSAGLGTIPRIVRDGVEIHAGKISFAEAELRLEACYKPYHAALKTELEQARAAFGCCAVIDCHSMPSIGGPQDQDRGVTRPDIVLGDRFGSAASPELVATAENAFRALGYRVVRNNPYAGGYTTEAYGRPAHGRHALQIEINRALYMDEEKIERGPNFSAIARDVTVVVSRLTALPLAALRSPLGDGRSARS